METQEFERRELFSKRVDAGRRKYYFDVRENRDGSRFLLISEVNNQGRRSRLMIFEEYLEDFHEGFQEAADFLAKQSP